MFAKKYKPAIRGAAKLEGLAQDFENAREFGSLRVGEQALFIEDMSVVYIPLRDLARLEIDVQPDQAGTCCGITSATTHDVTFTTKDGGYKKIKVVNACKAYAALQLIKDRNDAVDIACTGNVAALQPA